MDVGYDEMILAASELICGALRGTGLDMLSDPLEVDREVEKVLRGIGRKAVETLLLGRIAALVAEAEARGLKVVRRNEVTVECVFGAIRLESPYLRAGAESARPAREKLGITRGRRSLRVERALSDFGIEESFERASKRFEEHYGWSVGRTSILRLTEHMGEEAEQYVAKRLSKVSEEYNKPLAERPGVDGMVVEMDGSELRTGHLEPDPKGGLTTVRGLPKRLRPEAWRDVRVAFARQMGTTERTYVASLNSYPVVVGQLFGAAVEEGMSVRTRMLAVGDGGIGLMEELQAQFMDLQFILDRAHLKQHLYDTAKAIGLKDQASEAWMRNHLDRLHRGNTQEVLDDLARHKGRGKARVRRLVKHLTRFRACVFYASYIDANMPIGSGEVESAHRYIPQKRLKIPGACWKPETLNPMLALRVVRENGWWADFWDSRPKRMAA